MDAEHILATASVILFPAALLVNVIFIYIVYNNGKKSIGAYKYLLISFALCNIIHSTLEFTTKPAIHIYGTSYIAYSSGFCEDSPKWGTLMLCFFYAMYGIGTALLALHFLYRYITVCKPDQGIYFDLPYISLWIIPIVLWGLFHALIAYYCFDATDDFYAYAENSIRENLNRSLKDMAFFCIFTYKIEGGSVTVYWKASVGLAITTLLMMFTFDVMIVCGIRIARRLRQKAFSKKVITVQKQLLIALTVQALIPVVLSYMPRSLIFLSVIMGLPPLRIYMFVPLILTISTVLDPVAILFFVIEYRVAFIELFKRSASLIRKNKKTPIVNYSITTNITNSSHLSTL